MLKRITLSNFKCYESVSIDLAPLTVMSGRNAVGKSTVFQAINLLRQVSMQSNRLGQTAVPVDGDLVRFGSVDDLVNSRVPRKVGAQVSVRVEGESEDESAAMTLARLDEMDPLAQRQMVLGAEAHFPDGGFMGKHYLYLSADRISPQETFRHPDFNAQYVLNPIGNRGEFAPWCLGMNYSHSLNIKDLLLDKDQDTLMLQVALWMGKLGQDLKIEATPHEDLRIASLRFALWEKDSYSRWYAPRNVGFGLTHSLPIFVALLSCQRGSIVVIENPESHLHPKAQVEMGRFVARVASCGVQVLVETHSDHVLNGIRLAVRENLIASDKVALNFVTRAETGIEVLTPKILSTGAIDVWPNGFFDEYENVALELM